MSLLSPSLDTLTLSPFPPLRWVCPYLPFFFPSYFLPLEHSSSHHFVCPSIHLRFFIYHVLQKVNYGIGVLHRSRNCFTLSVCKIIASKRILPIMDYCDVVYQNAHKSDLAPLNTAYNRLCRFVLGCPFRTHHYTMYNRLKWPSLNVRWHMHWLQLIFKCIYFNYPPYLKQYFVPYSSNYQVRHSV